MKLDISDIGGAYTSGPGWDKSQDKLVEAIERFGREEIINRYCWFYDTDDRQMIDKLITDFLNRDWVDHRGTPQGTYFYGDNDL